jgi:hypothetical protein
MAHKKHADAAAAGARSGTVQLHDAHPARVPLLSGGVRNSMVTLSDGTQVAFTNGEAVVGAGVAARLLAEGHISDTGDLDVTGAAVYKEGDKVTHGGKEYTIRRLRVQAPPPPPVFATLVGADGVALADPVPVDELEPPAAAPLAQRAEPDDAE